MMSFYIVIKSIDAKRACEGAYVLPSHPFFPARIIEENWIPVFFLFPSLFFRQNMRPG